MRRRDPAGKWTTEIAIEDGNWDPYSPAIVPMGSGVMAIWSGQSNCNYDLFATTISSDGAVFSDFNARAATPAASGALKHGFKKLVAVNTTAESHGRRIMRQAFHSI